MKSCTASARCSTRCRATSGSGTRRCARCYGYMFVHPGKKLLFMGGEFGQWREWNHDGELDWAVLGDSRHAGLQRWVRDLNAHYAAEPALWTHDYDPHGFQWIDCNDHEHSLVSLVRRGAGGGRYAGRGRELHAGPALRLSHRRAWRRRVPGGAEQRRRGLRRQPPGQLRRGAALAIAAHGYDQSLVADGAAAGVPAVESEQGPGASVSRRPLAAAGPLTRHVYCTARAEHAGAPDSRSASGQRCSPAATARSRWDQCWDQRLAA